MTVTPIQIAFCAGFIEGEGSFTPPIIRENGSLASSARVFATQVSKDPLLRLQDILGGTIISKKAQKDKHPHWQDAFVWSLYGNNAIGFMMTVYDFMSERRKERIRICIELWKRHNLAKPSAYQVESAIKMYTEDKKSAREIAKIFGVHNTTVYEWLRGDTKNNHPVSTHHAPNKIIDETVVLDAVRRVLCGESRINVAKSINEDYYTVAAWFNGSSRPECLKKVQKELDMSDEQLSLMLRPSARIPDDVALTAMRQIRNGEKMAKAARSIGVSSTVVKQWYLGHIRPHLLARLRQEAPLKETS